MIGGLHELRLPSRRAVAPARDARFRELYQREKSGLYAFLLRLARDPNTAADLFQNVWLKLAAHAPRLRPESNLRAWPFTVARHEYASFRRAQALDLLLLAAGDGLDSEEAAGVLGISALAFRKRLARARQRLAAQLAALRDERRPSEVAAAAQGVR